MPRAPESESGVSGPQAVVAAPSSDGDSRARLLADAMVWVAVAASADSAPGHGCWDGWRCWWGWR